jgi:hypothetical protein
LLVPIHGLVIQCGKVSVPVAATREAGAQRAEGSAVRALHAGKSDLR